MKCDGISSVDDETIIQRPCPECDGELVLARRPDNQHRPGSEARQSNYWRSTICRGAFTAEQVREKKRGKQLDNTTA